MGRDVKFSQDELKVKEMMPQMFGPPVEVFTTPITPREYFAFVSGKNTDVGTLCFW